MTPRPRARLNNRFEVGIIRGLDGVQDTTVLDQPVAFPQEVDAPPLAATTRPLRFRQMKPARVASSS